jgi:ABC-type multidrug transport system fused ATPase/permease subunit
MVSMFFGSCHLFPLAFFKLVMNASFLMQLIGLKSIVAGYAISLLLIPLSSRLSKNHGSMQSSLSRNRDVTINNISEALQGIRQIRLLSLEDAWASRILRVRREELMGMWRTGMSMSGLILLANLSPILLSSISLSIYAFEKGELSPSIAFACLGLFADLHSILNKLPSMASSMHQSWISCNRIESYLKSPEKEQNTDFAESITFEKAQVQWPSTETDIATTETFRLHNVTLTFPRASLSVITGKTGSGKSLLLSSVLGDCRITSGTVKVPRKSDKHEETSSWILPATTAFVSQPPWIENCTIKDNILFGLPHDSVRYDKVLKACALEDDLVQLENGDMTNVGTKGVLLSGGQKWRVALARAVYSRAEILLLDDILSAVDVPVARWIVESALTGELAKDRTIILATHHPGICYAQTKYLVELADGTVKTAHIIDTKMRAGPESQMTSQLKELADSSSKNPVSPIKLEEDRNKTGAKATTMPVSVKELGGGVGSKKRQLGRLSWEMYRAYFFASGGWNSWLIGILATIGYQLLNTSGSWWLMQWTTSDSGLLQDRQGSRTAPIVRKIGVYIMLSLSTGVGLALQNLVFLIIGLRASESLFQRMTYAVLRAPLRWIDTVPTGQILNRFGSDFEMIDTRISPELNALLGDLVHLTMIVSTR